MEQIKILLIPADIALTGEIKVNCADMGEKTITATAQIGYQSDEEIAPYDWELEYRGEKYIMPLKEPGLSKENTAFDVSGEMTFQHWAIYQLKRKYFTTIQPTDTGTAVADKYLASVSLNLKDFADLLGQVLQRNYGEQIKVDLNKNVAVSNTEVATVSISYSHIWDVILKLYELYNVRWTIEAASDNDNDKKGGERYVIKIGYAAAEIDHIFQYGFEGGLLKIERQVQDDTLYNILLGRGGEENLPFRYFKDIDSNNPDYRPDPDWIPELANIYFDALRDYNFRCYVQGWKTNNNRQLTDKDGNPIIDKTTNEAIAVEGYDVTRGVTDWAYAKGHTDAKFDPVEYVKDDASISKYGELWNGLENATDIYPTIQGITVNPYGRIDEAVDVEQVTTDDYKDAAKSEVQLVNLSDPKNVVIKNLAAAGTKSAVIRSNGTFTVPKGKTANLDVTPKILRATTNIQFFSWYLVVDELDVESSTQITDYATKVYPAGGGGEHSTGGLTEGEWYYECTVSVTSLVKDKEISVELGIPDGQLTLADASDNNWGNTFDVWVKNIWDSVKKENETDIEYAERVWKPILGDRTGSEAKMMFTDGMLAISDDYEFVITKYPVYDTSKTLNGVASHWRITLAKSDADLESTGLYVPSTRQQGKAGDHFVFIGTEMTHDYTLWAEKRLREYKEEKLKETANSKPTWVVTTDKVRINNKAKDEIGKYTLFDQISEGCTLRLRDPKLITGKAYESLYVQSITKTFNVEGSILPDLEIVLSDKYESGTSSIATLSGDVEEIQKRLGSLGNTEQIVRAIGDKLYLRKDGISDMSISPTKFASLLTSDDFRKGSVDGLGWGMYKDADNNWVFEVDNIVTRRELKVNTLVINQISARGGTIIESAANMEVYSVVKSGDDYVCYFDQKGGSVANLFEVGDVAYCTRYDAENQIIKTYKRKVVAVGLDNLTLSGAIVNGTGIPSACDVIVQYGNYTNAERQYVKVRDVIGGGYERYLEGLDSVDAVGDEYFYVGRQTGVYNGKPRFFIGNKDDQYLEMLDGKITTNCTLEVTSKVGNQTLPDYIADTAPYVGENMIYNSAFEGGSNGWSSNGNIAVVVTDTSYKHNGYNSVRLSTSGNTKDKYYGMVQFNQYTPQTLTTKPGEQYTASVYVRCDDLTTLDYNANMLVGSQTAEYKNEGLTYVRLKPKLVKGEWVYFEQTFTASANAVSVFMQIYLQRNGTIYISQPKIEKGKKATAWCPNNHDNADRITNLDYIKKALGQSTSVSGGLILTSLIQVGEKTTDSYIVRAGMNGVWDGGTTPMLWAGGAMEDAANDDASANAAKFLVRADGTAYAAANTVRFNANTMEVGENVILDNEGLKLQDKDSGDTLLRITNQSIGDDVTSESQSSVSLNQTKSISLSFKRVDNSGADPTAIAIQDGAYLNNDTLASIAIGSQPLTEGSSISATISLRIPMTDNIVSGAIIARLALNGQTYRERSLQMIKKGNEYQATCTFSEVVNTAGTYTIIIATSAWIIPTSNFTEELTPSTLTVKGYGRYGEAPGNNIGNDGVRFTWGTTTFLCKEGKLVMRAGNIGLKVDETGIYKFDETTRQWVKANI